MTEVKLVKSSFSDMQSVPNHIHGVDLSRLEFVCMVSASADLGQQKLSDLSEALKLEAQKLDASYVFAVDYKLVNITKHGMFSGLTVAYGDAYRVYKNSGGIENQ